MNAAVIKSVLPHRYPMLLIDSVVELVPNDSIRARKAISLNEPWYANMAGPSTQHSHAYPSVLLIESWCQAAALLATLEEPSPNVLDGSVMLFGRLSNAQLHRDAFPGEVIEHRVQLVRRVGETAIFEGDARIHGELVLQVGQVMVTLRPARALRPTQASAYTSSDIT
ncbi:MAG: 3-hydroxyacyl-ACP dehydratase FabZ family protein [Myxococcota bacterium]